MNTPLRYAYAVSMSNLCPLLQTCHYTNLLISKSKPLISLCVFALTGSELSNPGDQGSECPFRVVKRRRSASASSQLYDALPTIGAPRAGRVGPHDADRRASPAVGFSAAIAAAEAAWFPRSCPTPLKHLLAQSARESGAAHTHSQSGSGSGGCGQYAFSDR